MPEEDALPGAKGVIRLLSPGWREYRSYEDATWTTDLPRGFERYAKWLDHEKRAQQEMLRMLHEHCPETRGLGEWPMFWTFVDAASSQDTVCFDIEHPRDKEKRQPAENETAAPAA